MRKISRRKKNCSEANKLNERTFSQYYNRLTDLAITMFEWGGLPDTIDQRFMELMLYTDGQVVFFEDEVLGFLCLQVMYGGQLNVYRVPIDRTAFAVQGYQRKLNIDNSVIIYNNYLHTNSMLDVEMFSKRLAKLDRTIDVNVTSQKTPSLIQCEDSQKLTMINLYDQYDGNEPVIFGTSGLDTNGVKVFKTDAPYVSDKLYELKTNYWNEALTYLGISNVSIEKKERMVTDEVTRGQGGVIASRFSKLKSREDACRQINKMFGLNVTCKFREDMEEYSKEVLA